MKRRKVAHQESGVISVVTSMLGRAKCGDDAGIVEESIDDFGVDAGLSVAAEGLRSCLPAPLETSAVLDTPLGSDEQRDLASATTARFAEAGVPQTHATGVMKAVTVTEARSVETDAVVDFEGGLVLDRVSEPRYQEDRTCRPLDMRSNTNIVIPTGFASGRGRQLRLETNAALERVARLFDEPAGDTDEHRLVANSERPTTTIPTGFASGCGRQLELETNAALERVARLFTDQNDDLSLSENSGRCHREDGDAVVANATPRCNLSSRLCASPFREAEGHGSSKHEPSDLVNSPAVVHGSGCNTGGSRNSLPEEPRIRRMNDANFVGASVRRIGALKTRSASYREPSKDCTAVHAERKRFRDALPRQLLAHHQPAGCSSTNSRACQIQRMDGVTLHSGNVAGDGTPSARALRNRSDTNSSSARCWSPTDVPRRFPRPPPIPKPDTRPESLVREAFSPWEALRFRFRASRNDSNALLAMLEKHHIAHSPDDPWFRFAAKIRECSDTINALETFRLFCPETKELELQDPQSADALWRVSALDLEPTAATNGRDEVVGSVAWFRRHWCVTVYELSLLELVAPHAWHGKVLTFWRVLFRLVRSFWRCIRCVERRRSFSLFDAITRSPHSFKYLPPTELLLIATDGFEAGAPAEPLCVLLSDGHALMRATCAGPRDAWLHRLSPYAGQRDRQRNGLPIRSPASVLTSLWEKAGRIYIAGARVVPSANTVTRSVAQPRRSSNTDTQSMTLVLSLNNVHPLPLLHGVLQSSLPVDLALHRSLGRARHAFRSISLPQTHLEGGPVPALDVILHRVYPLRFLVEQHCRETPTKGDTRNEPSRCVWSASYTSQYIERMHGAPQDVWRARIPAWTRQLESMTPKGADVSQRTHGDAGDTHVPSLPTETHPREETLSLNDPSFSISSKLRTLLTLLVRDRTDQACAQVQLWACTEDLACLLRRQYEGWLIRLRYVAPVPGRHGVWRTMTPVQFGVNLVPLGDHIGCACWIHWPRQQLRVSALATLSPGDEFDAAASLRLLHVGALRGADSRHAVRYVYAADDPDGPLLVITLRHEDAECPPQCLQLGRQRPYISGATRSDPYPLIQFEQCRYRYYDAALDAHVVDGTTYTSWRQGASSVAGHEEQGAFDEIAAVAACIAHGETLGEPFSRCRKRRHARVAAWMVSMPTRSRHESDAR
ncbi:hypothetical protein F1559_001377 [Cyanidiococcus yangmingshanensis]|uniref:Uncharacterized protein n=1 Tax=Cyanidiococcus yangmingshanensis TaxID=2690220 RepID=A0A7J7IEL3_9RHOD|nr:hypothetical protein F1559_001377 [Cyanidiococcus yangmingshanensis]